MRKVFVNIVMVLFIFSVLISLNNQKILAQDKKIEINEKNFPNLLIRTYVNDNYDLNNDGKLSSNEIKNAEVLDVGETDSEFHINSLKGLEYLTNLKKIRLRNCTMLSFNFNKNKELKELDLGFIKSLNISRCKKLEKLKLEGYRGKKCLNLKNQTKLKEISIDFSDKIFKLEDYHFSNKKGIKIMRLEVKTKKINFLQYPNLEELDLSGETNEVEINGLSRLRKLNIGVKINKIELTRCCNIEELKISSSKISKLDLRKSKKLKKLTLDCKNLKTLQIPKDSKIEYLYLIDLKKEYLDLGNMKYLKNLEGWHCQIKSVNLFNNLKLETVTWNYNNTEKFKLGSNRKLEKLNCCFNKIKSIDVSECTYLSTLQVGANNIKWLDLSQNTELTYVDCEMKSLIKLVLLNRYQLEEDNLHVSANTKVVYSEDEW